MALVARARTHDLHAAPGGLRGAIPRIEELIALRGAARHLTWQMRTRVRAARPGVRASRFRGRGIDFAETRVYEPGDDVRHIDWRVTARTGEAHTKIFQEERERPVLVVADLGPSSFFGTRRRMKSLAITELAGLLVWAAFDGGDRIGAIVRGPEGHQAFRPRHSRATVLRIQQRLVADASALAERFRAGTAPPADRAAFTLGDALLQARRVARPGTTVIVLSDFLDAAALDEDGEVRRNLRLLARHCEVDAVLVSDPFERELPAADRYPLSDGVSRTELDTGPASTRVAWRDAFTRRLGLLEQSIYGGRGRILSVGTEDDLDTRLGEWLR
ncbi:MAG: DUF58 domain-containing protein [Pseudomonadales bacterium]|jgi:uncharacterized protein (DUF58 family)|nr:DUF58 domain-containing protein [Pseudomonadales bacterium]